MAATATVVAQLNSSFGGTQTATTASFTPTANSKLVVVAIASNNNHTTAKSWSVSGGSLSWTVENSSSSFESGNGANYDTQIITAWADVGGSPSSMTVVVDAYSDTSTAMYGVTVYEVLGSQPGVLGNLQTIDYDDPAGAASPTLALGSGKTANSVLLAVIFTMSDGGTPDWASQPSGWTLATPPAVTDGFNVGSLYSTTDSDAALSGFGTTTDTLEMFGALIEIGPAGIVSFASDVGNDSTASASLSWAAGDIIVVLAGIGDDAQNINTPTGTGLTFSSQSSLDLGGGGPAAGLWTAVAGSSGSEVTVSVASSGGFITYAGFWVTRGYSGITGIAGQAGEPGSAFNQAVAAGDLVIVGFGEPGAVTPPARTPTTGSGIATERIDAGQAGDIGVWAADWVGVSAGTFNFGATSYTGLTTAQVGVVLSLPAPTVEQAGFRWGTDDGDEDGHGWEAAQDADLTAPVTDPKLLRFLLQATDDPASTAWKLQHQVNGTGGYVDTPVGLTTDVAPVIEAGDTTSDGDNNTTPASPWLVDRPTLATGDLIILIIGWDDSVNNTGVTPANGPNGETWTQIGSVVASASTEVRATAYYTKATGTWGAGTISVTPNANEQWTSTVIKVPAGEFDSTTPIGASATRASAGTSETSVLKPDLTAGSTDGGGRLVWAGCVDADPLVTLSSGYTSIANNDRGNVALGVAIRDAAVTDSEAVNDGTWSIASDSWCSLAFIVRSGSTVDNPVYVAASSNVTDGEATTQRLTGGTGSFTAGVRHDVQNPADAVNVGGDGNTELEFSVAVQDLVGDDYVEFRLSPVNTYTEIPRWTISSGTSASAGNAAGTGTANGVTARVSPSGGNAAGTGSGQGGTGGVKPSGGVASGSGAAQGITATVAAGTGVAGATGGSSGPGGSVSTVAAVASGTGTATDATVTVGTAAQAVVAAATGTAPAPQATIALGSGAATGTGTGQGSTGSVAPGSGSGAGTGTANDATVSTSAGTNAAATVASGTGAGQDPQISVAPVVGIAGGTGSGFDATVSTATQTNASAQVASGSGLAAGASLAIAPTSGGSAGSGTATGSQGSVAPSAGVGAGTGAGQSVTGKVAAGTGVAGATGAAAGPGGSASVTAGSASASGTTQNPTVSTANATQAAATVASGSGSATDATCKVAPVVGSAAATGTAHGAVGAPAVTGTAGVAAGTGTGSGVTAKVSPSPATAAGSGTGHDGDAQTGGTVDAGHASGSGTAYACTTTSIASLPGPVQGGGWWDLLNIAREYQQIAAAANTRQPVACPLCGEPLSGGWCRWDGWPNQRPGWRGFPVRSWRSDLPPEDPSWG